MEALGGRTTVRARRALTANQRAARGSYVSCIAGALSKSEYEAGFEAAGFDQISVEFIYQVTDGMHAAITKAVKTSEPTRTSLPIVQPVANAGCC